MRWRYVLPVVGLLSLAACGQESPASDTSPTPKPGLILQVTVEAGSPFYLKSPNVDPASIAADDRMRAVPDLPSGLVEVCHYKLSQGVEWHVWAGSEGDSMSLARTWCRNYGGQ